MKVTRFLLNLYIDIDSSPENIGMFLNYLEINKKAWNKDTFHAPFSERNSLRSSWSGCESWKKA